MIIKIILFFVIFLNLLLSIIVLIHNPKSVNNRVFAVIGLFASIWTFTNYMTTINTDIRWFQSTYAFGSVVMSLGLIWMILITNNRIKRSYVLIVSLISLFFFIASFFNGFILKANEQVLSSIVFKSNPGWGLILFTIYYLASSFLILWMLYHAQKITLNSQEKYKLRYIFSGSLLTLTISGLSSFILPHFSIFLFAGIDSLGFLLFLISIAYSITRYNLFDIKFVVIEIGIFILWIMILIRISLIRNIREEIVEIILFLLSFVLGIILIRTSLREARQREQLADLNLNLEHKVHEQTKEIKKSYELEKKAKRELEKLNETKDQFIMITQHNLRTPVTAIRWEIDSLLANSSYGINQKARKTLEDTKTSVESLTRILDDFLNITALKVGSQILNLTNGNLKTILENVLKDLRIDLENMNITVNFPQNKNAWPEIKMDANKIREVLLIIIENAIKYNFQNGSIEIKTETKNNIFKLIIENTGVGIDQEDKRNLFERLFYRGKKSQVTNPTGMGIGLSVSRAIVRAHHGDINIYSDGENKGARVEITIPIDFTSSF